MSKKLAVHGATCEADGHPSECQAVVSGSTQDADGDTSVTINGVPITDHGDSMHFDSHAHAYSEEDGCISLSSHDLVPDESPSFTVNGRPVVRVGDSTSDPGAGTATVVDSGGNGAVTHTE
ncbi:hypothetical protein M192_gp104 [Halorubrum tailed phage 8]|uniref:Uncharacterized protein n=3 Tax=Haloferacalesvirus TaxID=2843389 RepID=R4T7G4_9CAUD|nr:hypothetical protein M192_gp104 [Halorubrum tailed phage 8]UBF19100.1 PAAR repeat protein [Halorubrum phage HRTV-14]UBF19226.1 PAAR repeat protein [Halorubrum phage HRTV-17]UBF19353.1 PAAR repeat protein [Halorubrum virus HRTV-19]UBF19482.1 PAAR repeat protein [Halorubrum virus HRTV-23]AGM10775.1 hypothetical protein HRTV8_28 [Halorubrum tailed phage 8]